MRQASKMMKFVRDWDLDGSGEIERWEFRRAIGSMGVVAPSIAMIDALFDEMVSCTPPDPRPGCCAHARLLRVARGR